MTEGALTVLWSIVVRSMHLFALGGAALWLRLQVSCVMGLSVAACFGLWDLSNCSARVGLLSSRYDAAVCQCCSCTLLMIP